MQNILEHILHVLIHVSPKSEVLITNRIISAHHSVQKKKIFKAIFYAGLHLLVTKIDHVFSLQNPKLCVFLQKVKKKKFVCEKQNHMKICLFASYTTCECEDERIKYGKRSIKSFFLFRKLKMWLYQNFLTENCLDLATTTKKYQKYIS